VRLQEYIDSLRRLPLHIQTGGGIEGTGEIREYQVTIGRRNGRQMLAIRFTDYPGKYLMGASSNEDGRVQRALTRSDVIMVAIDTPALMEQDGRYHNLVNMPRVVMDQLKSILAANASRLIVLVPLKCERYLGTHEDARRLTSAVTESYATLLSYIAAGALHSRVGCVLAPAQTIGSVVFNAITDTCDGPVFHFRAAGANASYQPVDTDQPLRYALRFIVSKHLTDMRPALKRMQDKNLRGRCRYDGSNRQIYGGLQA
jgi:hypothetical protein